MTFRLLLFCILAPAAAGFLLAQFPSSSPEAEAAKAESAVIPYYPSIAPETTLASLIQQSDPSIVEKPLILLMQSWAQIDNDPLRAAQAAGEIANPTLRAAAFLGVARGWCGHDPYGAYQWVDSLSAGPQRDAAAEGLAFWKPDQVFMMQARAFIPEQRRLPILQSLFRRWNKSNPVTAAAALKASNLTPEERRILSAVMNGGAPENSSEIK